MTGCSKEQINKLASLILTLLNKTNNKQQEQTDEIEMLRKIELQLDILAEARDYIAGGEKKKELSEKEQKLHNLRRDNKIKKKKEFELEL